ncbi:phage portal protein [Streptomyces sp. DSM 41014]|uniref:Phage portal protein n=1 Tax=Streptomyces hintoniae TaxID=3075521 RepID=A0ABU2UX05_9ACTN|nr:phage portal protein [Streptomyces sp. DSM 41014]MDT0477391.1 phage portal protein [Streptomyces sp. DSM 41014]
MPLTLAEAGQLADQLLSELQNRTSKVERGVSYYKGEHPLRFASDSFRKHFEAQYKGFSDNWTQVVADSPVERLEVTGVKPEGLTAADKKLWGVWQRNGLDADSQLGFLGAGYGARAFVLVWGDPDDEDTPEVTFEDARQAIVMYVPGSRRKRYAALKSWRDGSRVYCTLYLKDEVWKLERAVSGEPNRSAAMQAAEDLTKGFTLRDTKDAPNPQPNPMGVVPMVELPNRPLLAEEPISDVTGVIAMQDAINLLWAQLFTASDFASFPQRLILGAEAPMTPILDKNGQVIGKKPVDLAKFAVDRILWITDEKAKAANWPAANLKAYTEVLEVGVGHIAAQTRTPSHYLIGRMANLSGDALVAAETGLVKKAQEKMLWFGVAIREVFRLIALARGETGLARGLAGGQVLWRDAESRNQAQAADMLLKLKQVGFPFEWLALRFGLSPTEVADLIEMRETEAEMDPAAVILGQRPRDSMTRGPGAAPGADDGLDHEPAPGPAEREPALAGAWT